MAQYTIRNDHGDGTYNLGAPELTDSEGEEVTDLTTVTFETTSTNPGVFSVTPGEYNPRSGTYHVGSAGVAVVQTAIKRVSDDVVIGHYPSDTMIVKTGEPTAASGGTQSFSDMTPDA